jgi:hypothetical protein
MLFVSASFTQPMMASLMLLLWVLGSLCVVLFLGITLYLRPLKPSIFSLQFAFSRRSFLAVLVAWESTGVARFRKHFVADYAFLVCYGLLGFGLATQAAWLSQAPLWQPLLGVLPWLLPVAAVLDVVENGMHRYLTRGQHALRAPSAMFVVTGGASTLKWLLIAVFAALALYAWVNRACDPASPSTRGYRCVPVTLES